MEDAMKTGMLTDRYELTMLSSFVADGSVEHRAVFEAFSRRLPPGRRYGLVAGLGRLLPLIEDFAFEPEEIDWLVAQEAITPACAAYLAGFRFRGDIDALPEGDVYFPGTPVVTVSGTLGECIVLETLVLSVLNHDTAVASAAARMVTAAQGRPLIEMGSRRTHEGAAVAVARAAYLAGFGASSNLAAGRLYGVPTVGTAAHAFVLAHRTEAEAFRSQMTAHGAGTTLLVDTYDTAQGLRNAVEVARELGASGPGAVRIDSGDLAAEAVSARRVLDELGATETRVTVTSDLDEYVIASLADVPIDGYGAGTRVATGSGHPTAGMVYKLVAVADSDAADASLRPVAKKSLDKVSHGGRKDVWRRYADGVLAEEIHTVGGPQPPDTRPALRRVLTAGEIVDAPTLAETREYAAAAVASLPEHARDIADGDAAIIPTIPTVPDPTTTNQEA
jgi:putative nicotinate phosphoribosyltransferase